MKELIPIQLHDSKAVLFQDPQWFMSVSTTQIETGMFGPALKLGLVLIFWDVVSISTMQGYWNIVMPASYNAWHVRLKCACVKRVDLFPTPRKRQPNENNLAMCIIWPHFRDVGQNRSPEANMLWNKYYKGLSLKQGMRYIIAHTIHGALLGQLLLL